MEKRTKFLLIGSGVVAVVGGYFLYKHLTKDASPKSISDFEDAVNENKLPAPSTSAPKPAKAPSSYKPAPANSTFPLKRKSKGTLVKDVQAALMKKYGGAILPKYGADGYYGEEMQVALTKSGIELTIDSDLYAKIIAGTAGNKAVGSKEPPKAATESADTIADLLYSGLDQRNIATTLRALGKITNVTHYIKINEKFKTKRVNGGVRMTIATALGRTFMFDPERTKYRAQLYRIGLKWRNDKWALAGTFGEVSNRLVTIKRAKIWDNSGNHLTVPKATIVGSFVAANNGLTEFLTLDGRRLFIDTKSISYHHD